MCRSLLTVSLQIPTFMLSKTQWVLLGTATACRRRLRNDGKKRGKKRKRGQISSRARCASGGNLSCDYIILYTVLFARSFAGGKTSNWQGIGHGTCYHPLFQCSLYVETGWRRTWESLYVQRISLLSLSFFCIAFTRSIWHICGCDFLTGVGQYLTTNTSSFVGCALQSGWMVSL